jgi:hypothetical protein
MFVIKSGRAHEVTSQGLSEYQAEFSRSVALGAKKNDCKLAIGLWVTGLVASAGAYSLRYFVNNYALHILVTREMDSAKFPPLPLTAKKRENFC